jgi:hypothetical protein
VADYRVVICGSLRQQAELDRLAAAHRAHGWHVLAPTPSGRPAAELDAEWLAAIERADLVLILRKPDGSLGAQTTRELAHAIECSTGPEITFADLPDLPEFPTNCPTGEPCARPSGDLCDPMGTCTRRCGMGDTATDCRSVDGITVGLIDGVIAIGRVLAHRDTQPAAVREALADLAADEDWRHILLAAEIATPPLTAGLLADARRKIERLEDLVTELRRQLAPLVRMADEQQRQRRAAVTSHVE